MANIKLTEQELRDAWRVFHEAGSRAEASRRLGIAASTLDHRLQRAIDELGADVTVPHVRGSLKKMSTRVMALPKKGRITRYILTSAQNNTHVHPSLWANLRAYAEHMKAEILVSRFTYNKASYGDRSVKPGRGPTEADTEDLWYAPEIAGHVCDQRLELAPGLVFCGELQIEPTARRPLSGFESYTGRKSSIIPHAVQALESVASGKNEATKFLYSTGTVTQLNYIQKRAGLKAEHHHCFGALIVEVDETGNWFVRQLKAGDGGEIYDLTSLTKNGKVTEGHRVEAITWGDLHAQRADQTLAASSWRGEGSMLDVLRPKEQHVHDPLDFSRRGHHDRRDPFRRLELLSCAQEKVSEELALTGRAIGELVRPWSSVVVVKSNHCRHLERWLTESDWREDLINAETLLSLQLAKVRAIMRGAELDVTAHALYEHGCPANVRFLGLDESHIICKDHDGGIECGMHGDLGPNGAKPSPLGLTKMGRRANIGHTHSAKIVDGVFVAGTSSLLDMKYNKGPSSWSHSHIITYPNGKRAIVTVFDGKWRAS